ncbi:DUF3981 domain-containing protein [Cytobacillus sp. IB215316]|uniref:DUF3981 domain-containing protein n=1 Tax=Cytobacillus sp. IB215316 TaxID=3097354 RepID=UPI002A168819|nr:DUF3981 domain-containing protein [Cytobacillus sp. IB215316]MDX8361545.1 DUF3981 domain-containing protein [Cytobacillus sp. IB215316]
MKFVILLTISLFMMPWTKQERQSTVKIMWIPVLFWLVIGILEYFFLIDNQISSILTTYTIVAAGFIILSSYFYENDNKVLMIKATLSVLLITAFVYTTFFHSMIIAKNKYEGVNFEVHDISEPFTNEDTPFSVPPETARNKMLKVFGNIDNVSYFELGDLTPQIVNGETLYVAPIEASGFFKARKAGSTPGYITMSGTNPDAEASLALGYEMQYVPSMYFNDNLQRIVRKAFPKGIFYGEPKFEIADDGKPFYTMTYGDKVSLRSGFNVKGVILVDPNTGDIQKYTKEKAPAFIDGVLNFETASLQNEYFGYLAHGYWNSLFSQTDVKIPTDWGTYEGVTPIFGKSGKMYYFTDFTSPKEGVDSALGYSLIDARTGELNYYNGELVKGVMDGSAAEEVVDNTFKKEKWHGTMPVIYNVYGEPSWVVPVTDDGGLVRQYAVILASNAKVFATGSTQKEAFNKYKSALSRTDSTHRASTTSEEKNIEGDVLRVYKEIDDGVTFIFILLDNSDKIFMVSSSDFPYAMFTEQGDTLKLEYADNNEQIVSVNQYQNLGID